MIRAAGDSSSHSSAIRVLSGMVRFQPLAPMAFNPATACSKSPFSHVKGQIDVIQAVDAEGLVVHGRGQAVGHRLPSRPISPVLPEISISKCRRPI